MRESPAERDILSYYERYDEQGRLGRGSGALEFARMQDLSGRFLAPRREWSWMSEAAPAGTRAGLPPRAIRSISSTRCRGS